MPPRSDIEAIDQPTVLYILYSTISAQQTNLLPENASHQRRHFSDKRSKVDMAYMVWCIENITLPENRYGCRLKVNERLTV